MAPDLMANFHWNDGLEQVDFEKRDELIGLADKLMEEVHTLINTRLTSRQCEVVKKIYFEQRTQMEVADMLGLCQTTIHKIISGNIDYSNGGKRYGGAIKKLQKLCVNSLEIQHILSRMSELKQDLG